MPKRGLRLVIIFIVVSILLIGLSYWLENRQTLTFISPTPTALPTKTLDRPLYKVIRIVDGDTIVVEIDNQKQTLRLIGIDSPELYKKQCFAQEALDKAKEILTGKNVFLEADSTQDNKDKYDRLLRYVFLEDGTNFNQLMIKEGFAHEYTYQRKAYKYQNEFQLVEKEAKQFKNGLWADGVCPRTN